VVVSAILAGADLKIISDNVLTVAEFVWAVKPESSIKTVKDFKGKKIGYTNPRSTSQALARMLLQAGGYTEADAELVKTGASARELPHSTRARSTSRRSPSPVVEGQGQVSRRRRRERGAAAARQRRRRDDGRDGGKEGRLPARGDSRAAQGGAVHEGQPGRSRE
jgi:hypothetical protein